MPIIISDASPLHYRILISEPEVLPALYGEGLIPQAVAVELQQLQTPPVASTWLSHPPAWLHIVPPGTGAIFDPALAVPGQGEREAITPALDRQADLILMDDREAVEQAHRLGLTVTGTWGFWSARPSGLGAHSLRTA